MLNDGSTYLMRNDKFFFFVFNHKIMIMKVQESSPSIMVINYET